MRITLENTSSIVGRPVDASIDAQDSISPTKTTMVRLNGIPNKAMRIIGCIDFQYSTKYSDRIYASISSQNSTIGVMKFLNLSKKRSCIIDWIAFYDAFGIARYSIHTSINADNRSSVLYISTSQVISDI